MKDSSRRSSPSRPWLASGVLFTMVAAPLYRAGQPPLALMGLEFAALILLLVALWRPPAITRRELVALALLALFPLFYLIPLPLDFIAGLPGRAVYLEVWRTAFGDQGMPTSARPSLVPGATEVAWLTLLVPIGVFVAVRALAPRQLPVLVSALLAIGAVQATLGLMQFGDGPDSSFYLGMTFTHFDSAVGTYTNRNHLAGLIEMILPIALALLFYNAGRGRDQRQGSRARAAFLGLVRGQGAMVYAALLVLLLVAMAFTKSRTGISLAMLAILLSVALFSRRIGGDNAFGMVGTLFAVGLGLAVTIGLVPVLDRFSTQGVIDDMRWEMFDSTLTGIGVFLPLGSGPGTYADIFPAFQPVELGRWFINRAHNDYLEWVFEGGLPAALLIGGLLTLYAMQWRRVWAHGEWSRLRFIQVGAGIGILLLLIHELVDYNLHIPANMVFFAVLLGIFFSEVDAGDASKEGQAPRRTLRMGEAPTEAVYAPVTPAKPAPDQIKNPFLDD